MPPSTGYDTGPKIKQISPHAQLMSNEDTFEDTNEDIFEVKLKIQDLAKMENAEFRVSADAGS